jgi:hypothetical protein
MSLNYWAAINRLYGRNGVAQPSEGSDAFIFGADTLANLSAQNAVSLFKAKTGEDLLEQGAPGYLLQRQRAAKIFEENKTDLAAFESQAKMNLEQLRYQRTINQSGGFRNGIARNPFNMNMMRGPQNEGTKRFGNPNSNASAGGGGANLYNNDRAGIQPGIAQRPPGF